MKILGSCFLDGKSTSEVINHVVLSVELVQVLREDHGEAD